MNFYFNVFVLIVAAISIFMLPKKYQRAGDPVSAKLAKIGGYVYAATAILLFVLGLF